MATSMSRITWLHLSDWHQRGKDFNRQGNKWLPNIDSSDNGRFEFSLPDQLRIKPGSQPSAPLLSKMRANNALERYRELLLETCDIIDLANLPEQDRNLAHRELELRRLYVPLRVWVEAKASAKTRDDTWIALEEHQYRTWRGEPRRVDKEAERAHIGHRLSESRQLEQITRAYPALPIIATSRIVGYREMRRKLRAGFEHLTLAELTKEEKDDFAQRWCLLTERPERWKQAAAELVADIHSSEGIERLTGSLCS